MKLSKIFEHCWKVYKYIQRILADFTIILYSLLSTAPPSQRKGIKDTWQLLCTAVLNNMLLWNIEMKKKYKFGISVNRWDDYKYNYKFNYAF